jgi:hypothetical protein
MAKGPALGRRFFGLAKREHFRDEEPGILGFIEDSGSV